MSRKALFGVVAIALAMSACDARSAGGCDARSSDGTCRDWFAPSAELEARQSEARSTCDGLGASYQETDFTCSTSGKVGACVVQSLTNGPRIFYYEPSYSQESARSACASLGGVFIE